ncbi:MAG: sulfite exporter TauE/SafE family protein [Coriobacteriales bacterium]|jgi:uncharacterized membrane protein YfcA|nr:sulfite exporter TauE/SafE family protein [Coriobacteriales bacterium]
MGLLDFIIVTVCGFGIGAFSGMFGIGGGGLIVPLLHMAFGLPIIAATSTSLLTIAPTGISGSIKHIRQKTASLKTGLLIGGSGAFASVGGSLAADSLPEYLIVVLTVAVILFSVGMMLWAQIKGGDSDTTANPEERLSRNATSLEKHQQNKLISLALPLCIGLIAGGIAGIVGVGGGFIIVPFCVVYLGFSMKKAAGTSLIAIAIIAVPGIVTHALADHIWWLYGLAIIIGTIPGAQLGAWLIARLPERPMRFAFAGLLLIVGAMMLLQEFLG